MTAAPHGGRCDPIRPDRHTDVHTDRAKLMQIVRERAFTLGERCRRMDGPRGEERSWGASSGANGLAEQQFRLPPSGREKAADYQCRPFPLPTLPTQHPYCKVPIKGLPLIAPCRSRNVPYPEQIGVWYSNEISYIWWPLLGG